MKKKFKEPKAFDSEELKAKIITDAKAIKMPVGAAEVVAEKVTKRTMEWLKNRSVVTSDDLNLRVAKEIEKYNADLAYVYRNRGKII